MYYHASSVKGIEVLQPHSSSGDTPVVYFSKKRENVLVYLSNAIEKYCKESDFEFDGEWEKFGPYGFTRDGRLCLSEYYPNALVETYKGVSAYIYSVKEIVESDDPCYIRDAAMSTEPTKVDYCEFVPDAYDAILEAERQGLITIVRYEENSPEQLEWIERTMKLQYKNTLQPDYRHFLEGKFPFVKE